MQRLSLSGGKFVVELTPQQPSGNGLEQVEFMVQVMPALCRARSAK
jgi:DNA repair protein RecN (Recombination protein N)